MKSYQVSRERESDISNHVIEEMNAIVLPRTFPNLEGSHKADVYKGFGPATIVHHGACGPVHQNFQETILIHF